jgi:hypothetical protein
MLDDRVGASVAIIHTPQLPLLFISGLGLVPGLLALALGAGRAGFAAQTPLQRCASQSSCSRPLVGFHRMRTCTLQAAQPRAHNSAADEPASRHTFGQRIHTSIPNSSLAPRRRTRLPPISIRGRPLAEERLGRKGAWGGREAGADGMLGRTGCWDGREAGAEASLERKRAWGGREHGAEGNMGRKGA